MVVKLLPLLGCWFLLGLATTRYCRERKKTAALAGAAGFAGGVCAALLLIMNFKGDIPFLMARNVVAVLFMVLAAVAVAAVYRSSGVSFAFPLPRVAKGSRALAIGIGSAAGLLAGGLCALRLPLQDSPLGGGTVFLLVAGPLLAIAGGYLERSVPSWLALTRDSYILFAVSLVLLISSHTLRLDIFSPLTMKVTKFIHDFVHQFFESMLIPDHPFFRTDVWDYIGLLFSSGVGFWGGLVIWFTPPLLVLLAIGRERLPPVTHIRQGATRRKIMAGHIGDQRRRMIVPWLAVAVFTLAVYKSRSPAVEYWDPKPVPVAAGANGEIFIPRKSGEIDLEDGKLHKFLYKEGRSSVRFFVLMKGDGHAAVALDACSICQPDGYGQAEGAVVCYYCKTLIPLETVGMPGGCNPVPVSAGEAADGVRISAPLLVNTWNDTVQSAKKVPGRGK